MPHLILRVFIGFDHNLAGFFLEKLNAMVRFADMPAQRGASTIIYFLNDTSVIFNSVNRELALFFYFGGFLYSLKNLVVQLFLYTVVFIHCGYDVFQLILICQVKGCHR
jgi:hypothetical protein